MIKKTITYEDYNGAKRTEDHFFNLNEAELTTLFNSFTGGFEGFRIHAQNAVQKKDIPELMNLFREILRLSYGEKSADGRHFRKSPEIFADFEQTEAYSELFMELLSNPEVAGDFIQGVMPKKLGEEMRKKRDELRAIAEGETPEL